MIRIFDDLSEARAFRKTLPTEVGGFKQERTIRKTLDGKFAVISVCLDCWLNDDTLRRYNLPLSTFGWFDDGEPTP